MPIVIREKDINAATVFRKLREVLDDVQDRIKWEDIRMRHSLEGDLGLNGPARGALAALLNARFAGIGISVTGVETRAAKSVETLQSLLMEKVFAAFPNWPQP